MITFRSVFLWLSGLVFLLLGGCSEGDGGKVPDIENRSGSSSPRLFDRLEQPGFEASLHLTTLKADLRGRWSPGETVPEGKWLSCPLAFFPGNLGAGRLEVAGQAVAPLPTHVAPDLRKPVWHLQPGPTTLPLGSNAKPIRLVQKEGKRAKIIKATLPESGVFPVTRLLRLTVRGHRAFNRQATLKVMAGDATLLQTPIPHPKPYTYEIAFDQSVPSLPIRIEAGLAEASIPVWDDVSEDTASLQIDRVEIEDLPTLRFFVPELALSGTDARFSWTGLPARTLTPAEQAFRVDTSSEGITDYLTRVSRSNHRLGRVLIPGIPFLGEARFDFPCSFTPEASLTFSVGLPPTPGNHTFVQVTAHLKDRPGHSEVLLEQAVSQPLLATEAQWHELSLVFPREIKGRGTLELRFSSTPGTPEVAAPEPRNRSPFAYALLGNPRLDEKSLGRADDLPNLILICIDTLRADHLSCYGYTYPVSPEIDALARNSLLFTEAVSTSSWTLPAHIAFLGGTPLGQHRGLYKHQTMLPGIPTLAECLRAKGYRTAAFVGGGYVSAEFGMDRGFDLFNETSLVISGGLPRVSHWLQENKDKGPFFLFFHFFDVHSPYGDRNPDPEGFFADRGVRYDAKIAKTIQEGDFALEPHCSRFKVNVTEPIRQHMIHLYDADIAYVDTYMKRFFDFLEEESLMQDSALIITSDHGEEFGEHGNWYHSKHLYREVVNVPLIVKLPGKSPPRGKINIPVSTLDLAPTLLALAGEAAPPVWYGTSLLDILEDPNAFGKRKILSENVVPQGKNEVNMIALRDSQSKFFRVFCGAGESYADGVRGFSDGDRQELYFLDSDPEERINLADFHPRLLEAFKEESLKVGKRLEENRARSGEARLSPEVMERLRALGYMK